MSGIGGAAASAAHAAAQQSAAEAAQTRVGDDDADLAQAMALSLREAQLSEMKAMFKLMLDTDGDVKTLDIQMNCISAFNEGEKASFSVTPEGLDTILRYIVLSKAFRHTPSLRMNEVNVAISSFIGKIGIGEDEITTSQKLLVMT